MSQKILNGNDIKYSLIFVTNDDIESLKVLEKKYKDIIGYGIINDNGCSFYSIKDNYSHSILNHWTDVAQIEYWFCVDENSNELERNSMKKLFGWIDYYFKTSEEKSHLKSMNIIWNKLNELKPAYWIHIDNSVIFIDKMNYIEKSIQGFNIQNVKQILFNINYSKIMDDYNNRDFINLDNGFGILNHNKVNLNNSYFSLKPSLIDVKTILELGDFNTEEEFFEREYANSWANQGNKTAFFDKITHIHIGDSIKKDD